MATTDDTGPFGLGPFTDGLTDNPPHPPGLGYGSLVDPESSATYGFSPYGSVGTFGISYTIEGGYGGDPYGEGPYGAELELVPPGVSSAVSLNGFQIEIHFSESMRVDAAFLDALNYSLASGTGAAPVTVTSVAIGTETEYGANSAIITVSGTTLGGVYTLTVVDLIDHAGNLIQDGDPGSNQAEFIARGSVPSLTVTPISGEELLLDFDQDLLTEAENPDGVDDESEYGIQTEYPVIPIVTSAEHQVDLSQVLLTVTGQTSTDYEVVVGPADAITYDASLLPSADPGFSGTEVGTGSSSLGPSELLLSKASGDTYGWNFAESPNVKILPNSSFRAQFSIGQSQATFDPALTDGVTAFAAHISDGSIQVTLNFLKSGGLEIIRVVSGTLIQDVTVNWSGTSHDIALVRNEYADSYTVVVDDTPLLTVPATGVGSPDGPALIPPGIQIVLGSGYEVTDFPLTGIQFDSSQTLYTSAWNFIHGLTSPFTGVASLALDTIRTQYGPLVKTWGDPTLATTHDVEVRVNGTPVGVSEVNPYTGEITTTIPIPRTAAGSNTVEVDYAWFPNPILPMAGLNTPGLILNKYDRKWGRTATTVGTPENGTQDFARFPYAVVLGPEPTPCEPVHIGHRFIGFESDYTAALNSPNTLLLNQRPFGASKPYTEAGTDAESITLTFGSLPSEWEQRGTGDLDENTTSYTVEDVGEEDGFAIVRRVDLSTDPARLLTAARLEIDTYTPDGVWSGVCFGFHDNDNLYLVGALVIDGMEHVGILLDANAPEDASSWFAGPRGSGAVTGSTQVTFPLGQAPPELEAGQRFQIVDGSQAGQYTVSQAFYDDDEVVIDTVETFPADFTLWGNRDVIALFENVWSTSAVTWKLDADTETRDLHVVLGGDPSGTLTFDTSFDLPAPSAFDLLDLSGPGEVFWGSLSRKAENVSDWSLLRWESMPAGQAQFSRGTVENVDFSSFDEEGWFPTSPFGYDTAASSLEFHSHGSYGYRLDDPFLNTSVLSTLQARFEVGTWTTGYGDAVIQMRDRKRVARLATLAYRDSGTKSLIQLPTAILTGGDSIAAQGWSETGDLDIHVDPGLVEFTKAAGESGTLTASVSGGTEPSSGEKVAFIRLAIPSWAGDPGLRVEFDSLSSIGVEWRDGTVVLVSGATDVASFAFAWTDGLPHGYEVRVLSGTVVQLSVDGLVLGTAPLASFPEPVATGSQVRISATSATTYKARIFEVSVTVEEPVDTEKTFGVWLGGDEGDIDNWALPRTDGTDVPNSDAGSVIEAMDWGSTISARLHLDPTWGLVIERPDIPLPPGYDPDDMATQSTNPSRGWIAVEYRNLPFDPTSYGSVFFGSRGLSDQTWEQFYYRIYTDPLEEYLAPYHMVLNQYNVLSSGEYEVDSGVEVVVINSLTDTLVPIRAAHQNAARIFMVQVNDVVQDPSTYEFDADSQMIRFLTPLPLAGTPVTVTFSPGQPVTKTYLANQPFSQSVTKLNEGTPPFFKSQIQNLIQTIVSGSRLNDINDILNVDPDFILNDPFQTTTFEDDPEALYENLEFFEVPNGGKSGQIAAICTGPAPEVGFAALGIEGEFVKEENVLSLGNSEDPFEGGGTMLIAGGLGREQGELNSTDVLVPAAPSQSGAVSAGTGRRVDRIDWALRLSAVLVNGVETDLEEVFDLVSDSYAPTDEPAADPNPSSVEYPEGAAWYRLVDGGTTDGIIS